ncbi:hypothetical protein SAMN05443574_1405 [Haloarcula vallismortis]|uniref:Uncharacterized protein n=3 Tax=Haloarcula vallismortis TaxID=28442 RepID=M0JDR7_HALVA|nr:hypothetical protein C437_12251 [Haloarcula vallismortis ATCC 29715]SDX38118.1 hypothetical protein SAMN05443574_1405 [Haloarcula vallismortis]
MPDQITEQHQLSQDASALQQQLETDKLANRLRFHLGLEPVEKVDTQGNKTRVWKERENNLLNQEGVENVVGLVRGIVDKNQTTSIYDDSEIKRVMQSLHRAVSLELTENWGDYGIRKRGTAEKVMEIVTDNCYSAFKRAKDGRTLDAVAKTTKTVSKTHTGDDDGDGGMSFFGLG